MGSFTCLLISTVLAASAPSTQSVDLRVGTWDDLDNTVPGTVVFLDPVTSPLISITSQGDGFTDWQTFTEGQALLITLGETTTANGTTMGMKFMEVIPEFVIPADEYYFTRTYHQPVARPTLINTSSQAYAQPFHNRWRFVPFTGAARLSFRADVAILLNTNEIDGYAAYHGVQFSPHTGGEFLVGLVIRCNSSIALGTNNLALEIDCRGHSFTTIPCASTFLVSGSPGGSYSFSAQPSLWQNERIHLVLSGTLEQGDNVVLIHSCPSPSSPAGPLQDSPPQLGSTIAVVEQDCIPTPPLPPSPWTCTPPNPDLTTCPITVQSTGCGTKTIEINKPRCGGSGDSKTIRFRTHKGGSVSIPMTVGSTTITLTGEYDWEWEDSVEYNFSAGANGCGECKQDFKHYLACKTIWSMEMNAEIPNVVEGVTYWLPWPCSVTAEATTECSDEIGPSTVTCPRICHP